MDILTNETGEKFVLISGQLYKLVPVSDTAPKRRGRPRKDASASSEKPKKAKKAETKSE